LFRSAARLSSSGAASASSAALRARRDAVWQARAPTPTLHTHAARPSTADNPSCIIVPSQDIVSRGADASGVGWLLRGFYKDHARVMDVEELC
jgi:hypothetical protein